MCGGCWRNPTKVSAADGRVKGGHGVEGNSNHQWGGAGGGAKSNLKTRPSRCTIVGCNTPRNAPSLSRSVPQLSFVFSSPATFSLPSPLPVFPFFFLLSLFLPFFLPLLFPPPLLLFLLLLVLLLIRLGRSATRSATMLKVQAERSRSRPSCLHVRHSLHRSLSLPPSLSLSVGQTLPGDHDPSFRRDEDERNRGRGAGKC